MKYNFIKSSVLPGFSLTFGLGVLYFSFLVLIPICALVIFSSKLGISAFFSTIFDKQVLLALSFSLQTAAVAAFINLILGFIVAWSLSRYEFPFKRILEALVDLPFALPTAVAGISIAFLLSSSGIVGQVFGIFNISLEGKSFLGVVVALIFIGIPFVVRTLEPVIKDLDTQSLEAASSLGASFSQTFFKVILPSILPSALTGFALAFARGLGEYGSVIFVSSNIPFESEILPIVIVGKLDSFNYAEASAIGCFMIFVAFILLLAINFLQKWSAK